MKTFKYFAVLNMANESHADFKGLRFISMQLNRKKHIIYFQSKVCFIQLQ